MSGLGGLFAPTPPGYTPPLKPEPQLPVVTPAGQAAGRGLAAMFTLPGDILAGRKSLYDQNGQLSREATDWGAGTALGMVGGSSIPRVTAAPGEMVAGSGPIRKFALEPEGGALPQPKASATPESLGFDPQTYYHGTDEVAKGVQPFAFRDPAGKAEQAIFLADHPEIAGQYGDNVMPLRARMENPRDVDWPAEVHRQTGIEDYAGYDANVMKRLIDESRAAGHDSVRIRNFADYGGPQNQTLVFNPNQLRSPEAAFDPALKHSPYLLGGIGAASATPLAKMFLPPPPPPET